MSLINAQTLNHLVIPPAFLSLLLFASTIAINDASKVTADDTAYSVHGTLNGSFPFNQPIRLVSTGSVAHGTLRTFGQFNGFSQDSFNYEANYAYVGADSFTYHACDSDGNCVDGTITLNVQNGAPHAVTDSYVLHGILYGGGDTPLTLNDTDPEGDALRVVSVTQAANGSFRYFFEYDSFIYEPN